MKDRSNPVRLAVLVLLLPLLGGCMLAQQSAPLSILAPEVSTEKRTADQRVPWSLQVQRPISDAMRDSDRVLVRIPPSRLQTYPGAAWLDSAPDMLQALMIRSFSDTGVFAGVSRAGGMRTRYSLASELRNFEAVDDGGGGLTVEITLQASLIHQRSARAIASRSFVQRQRVGGSGLDNLVAAFEEALHGLITDLTDWVLTESASATARSDEAADSRERRQGRE